MGGATSGVYAMDGEVAGGGSAVAFAALYREHAPFTWSCLRRLGVSPAAIDDAMQELWVAAHRRLGTLRSPAASRAWLFGIARRVASHHRRTELRHRRRVDAFGEQAPSSTDAERESTMQVEAILASLDARVREAFVLSELEGWSAAEISAATGANTNTIYWRVRTARHQLQAQLASDEVDARLAVVREQTKPPRKAIAHAWVVLAPRLVESTTTGGLLAGWSLVKVMALGASVTVGVAAIAEVGARARDDARSQPAAISSTREVPADASEPTAVAAAELPVTSPPVVASTPAAAIDVPIARPTAVATRESARVERPTASAPAGVPASPVDLAAEEARLLADLKVELAAGRNAAAARLLREHHDRFPTSTLADVRAALSIELACASGRVADGRRELAQWRARLGEAKRTRLEAVCDEADG